MRSRGLVVAIAVVLAIVAAAAVILYTNGVKSDAVTGGALSVVVVSKQDIAANTNLTPRRRGGVHRASGADRRGRRRGGHRREPAAWPDHDRPVLANEQIPVGRLSGGEAPKGGSLGISEGNVGPPIVLDEAVQPATATSSAATTSQSTRPSSPSLCRGSALRQILNPAQLNKLLNDPKAVGPIVPIPFKFTAAIVPSARVLNILNPVAVEGSSSRSPTSP